MNFNYRVNAFGWLAGKEALAAGIANNGLYDRECHLDSQTSMPSGRPLTIVGFDRTVLPGMGQVLYLQVWRRPGYDNGVS